jgi:hypothetical protein
VNFHVQLIRFSAHEHEKFLGTASGICYGTWEPISQLLTAIRTCVQHFIMKLMMLWCLFSIWKGKVVSFHRKKARQLVDCPFDVSLSFRIPTTELENHRIKKTYPRKHYLTQRLAHTICNRSHKNICEESQKSDCTKQQPTNKRPIQSN